MASPYYDTESSFGGTLGGMESAFSEKAVRMGFIRKVYGILMAQLAITVGFICLFTFEKNVRQFAHDHQEMFWIAFVLLIVVMIALACCDNVRRSFPLNIICLFLFTLIESFLLGVTTSRYNAEEVLWAAGICAVVCLALTIFAFQTKWDFTMCGGMLFVMIIILIIFALFAVIFPGKVLGILYASLGALVFSLYLVYDTQLLIGGKHKYSISPEEYIFAALNLYLDIVNLFIFILQLTSLSKD